MEKLYDGLDFATEPPKIHHSPPAEGPEDVVLPSSISEDVKVLPLVTIAFTKV